MCFVLRTILYQYSLWPFSCALLCGLHALIGFITGCSLLWQNSLIGSHPFLSNCFRTHHNFHIYPFLLFEIFDSEKHALDFVNWHSRSVVWIRLTLLFPTELIGVSPFSIGRWHQFLVWVNRLFPVEFWHTKRILNSKNHLISSDSWIGECRTLQACALKKQRFFINHLILKSALFMVDKSASTVAQKVRLRFRRNKMRNRLRPLRNDCFLASFSGLKRLQRLHRCYTKPEKLVQNLK